MARRLRIVGGHSPWLIALWGAVLIATAAVTSLSSLAALMREQQPDTILTFDPRDALAQARRSELLLAQSPEDQHVVQRARTAALAALSYDPTRVTAWRSLAAVQQNNNRADQLLLVAQWLSRRDPLTQLALLEYKVQHGDVAGALQHYDNILRVSTVYDRVLFPVLAYAGTDPNVQPALVARLASASAWRRRFFSYLASSNTAYHTQAVIYAAMARHGKLSDSDIVGLQATNATLGGDYRNGETLFKLADPGAARLPLRDGNFASLGGITPYSWMLEDGGFLRVATAVVAGRPRLEMESPRGDGGRGVRQLVQLPAGKRRISATIGQIEGDISGTVYATLACAQGSPISASSEARADTGRIVVAATIPAGCYPQWLEFGLRQSLSGDRSGAWVSGIRAD
ncbi:hypothetical protein SFC76_16485 [Sphingomonas sp. CD22]|uniref:hypothetical protein n=1 Tax=Sphingomonas sp. CD22 TaxID=3100214 RepID=UPI002ADFAC34|nr:hypothetical protein [Sphingomonas sp. CD22]MEA1085864.1 hypothetical protein [Sphingomonas sp. CD22]